VSIEYRLSVEGGYQLRVLINTRLRMPLIEGYDLSLVCGSRKYPITTHSALKKPKGLKEIMTEAFY